MVKLVNVILISAIEKGATHIHIEPTRNALGVRYRIDGILYDAMAPPLKMRDALTARIKTMAKLNVGEKRIPQQAESVSIYRIAVSVTTVSFRCRASQADEIYRATWQSACQTRGRVAGIEPQNVNPVCPMTISRSRVLPEHAATQPG